MNIKIDKLAIMKCLVIILIFLLLAFSIALIAFYRSHRARIIPLNDFNKENVELLRKVYRIDFPESTVFKNVTMYGGKDWTLYSRIAIPASMVEIFKKKIRYEILVEDAMDTYLKFPDIPWWNINESQIEVVYADKISSDEIFILKPENNEVIILIQTEGGPSGYPREIWDIFQKK